MKIYVSDKDRVMELTFDCLGKDFATMLIRECYDRTKSISYFINGEVDENDEEAIHNADRVMYRVANAAEKAQHGVDYVMTGSFYKEFYAVFDYLKLVVKEYLDMNMANPEIAVNGLLNQYLSHLDKEAESEEEIALPV